MIDKKILDNCLFLDVETATGYPSWTSMSEENPRLAKLWGKRADYYRKAYPEYSDEGPAKIYAEKASLEPEFSRVVCVSFGVLSNGEIRFQSFAGENERDILEKVMKVLTNAYSKGMKLCGHNIKGFDVPCLGKRMLYSGITPPTNLIVWDKKPWDIPFLDTAEVFSFGNWVHQKYLSLDLLSCSLGIDSPKDDIDGSMVSKVFWEEGDHERIKEYCEKDVKAVIDVLLKIAI